MTPTIVSLANERAAKASARSPFPHMSPADSAVWRTFLRLGIISFTKVLYDVGVGGKAAGLVPAGSDLHPMWETLLKKRVDAVGFTDQEVLTIEVKPTAGMSALGQALTYSFLWNAEGRSQQKSRPCVVCSRIDLDVEALFIAYGVLVIAVSGLKDGEQPALEKILGVLPK